MQPRRFRRYCIVAFGISILVAPFLFPAAMILEFSSGEVRNFFVTRYPHILLYPPLFLWLPISTICFVMITIPYGRSGYRKILYMTGVLVILSGIITYAEEQENFMMVFEFNAGVQKSYCLRERTALSGPPVLADHCLDRDLSNDAIFSRERWSSRDFSWSRPAYLLTFFFIVFLLGENWILLLACPSRGIDSRLIFLKSLLVAAVGLIVWVPLRLYYNQAIKSKVFGNAGLYQGFVGGPEFLLALVTAFFIIYYWIELYDVKPEFAAAVWSVLGLGIPVTAFLDPDFVRALFGVDPPSERTWVLWYAACLVGLGFAYVKAQELRRRSRRAAAIQRARRTDKPAGDS
ncbi:MAG TPA: hypothetical protein PKA09_26515 [Geminicoccus sp.]|nr:hypothetical protein [Geminicoccus sp.]